MHKPGEFSRKARPSDQPASAPLDDTAACDGRRWFAEARAQSAREEREVAHWRARRNAGAAKSDSGSGGWFSDDGSDGGGDGGGD